MKNKTLLLLSILCISLGVSAQDDPASAPPDKYPAAEASQMSEEQMMKAWMELIALGDEHAEMAQDVGEYSYVNTAYPSPDAPPSRSTGTSIQRSIMDGRYFIDEHTGTSMGMPFHGMSIQGYDTAKKKYITAWIDNFGTGILLFEGEKNADGQIVSYAHFDNPMTGTLEKHKSVITRTDKGYMMDYYLMQPDGTGFKMMNIDYTRINK